jgi:Protein of unknown function (DUF1573)
MNKISFLLMLALGAGMANAQQVTATTESNEAAKSFIWKSPSSVALTSKDGEAAFVWDEQIFDFGVIVKGKPVTHEFQFINAGKVPLIINGVKASCGCTTPEWTKEPIPVGGTGYIKAIYSAANVGAFNKTISVTANVNSVVVLTIKGVVE